MSPVAPTWSGTVELKPRLVAGLDVKATYFNIDYRDRLASPFTSVLSALYNPIYDDFIAYDPSAADVNALIATVPGGLVGRTRPARRSIPGEWVRSSTRRYATVSAERIHGIDVDADYRIELGRPGTLRLSGSASYLVSAQQLAAGQPFLPLAGTIFHPPHWRGRAGMTWDVHGKSLPSIRQLCRLEHRRRACGPARGQRVHDARLHRHLAQRSSDGPLRNVELRLAALNILNQKPHVIRIVYPSEAPYNSTNESPVGRFLGASLRKVW